MIFTRTELIANVRRSPAGVIMPETLTMHAPQPPSRHINLVPVNLA